MAKVDILLPFWGDVSLLKKAVESVLNQSETDWQLLVFDDCYPSEESERYFAKLNDRRIRYTRHSKNIGITKNFNFAAKAAKAKYCVMMGCDDIMLPNYLERSLQLIEDADFYQPRVVVINERGEQCLPLGDRIKRILRPRKSGIHSGQKLATSLCHGNWLYFPSILWKTDLIKKFGFDNHYGVTQDVDLEFKIILSGGQLYIDNQTTFQYRRFSESVSSKEKKTGKRFDEEDKVYKDYATKFAAKGWKRAALASRLRITSRLHNLMN